MENECVGCEYYDGEDDICKAFECFPAVPCDEPLPCEREVRDNEKCKNQI